MRKNPELEHLSQLLSTTSRVLATPAAALVPNCNSFAVPLDQSVSREGCDDVDNKCEIRQQ